jgi:hypothetical protein
MAIFTVDSQVKVKRSTIEGVVKGAALDNTTLEIQYLVEYVDYDGVPQSRYFKESDLNPLKEINNE